MKKISVFLCAILAGFYLLFLVAVKAAWIDRSWFTGTTAVSTICMHTYFSLIVFVLLLHWGLRLILKSISARRWKLFISGLFLVLIGFGHSAHLIVRDQDAVREKILFFEIRHADYDLQLQDYNLNGYSPVHHSTEKYSCYEYCESFFTRRYQTADGIYLNVYRGPFPLLRLSDDHWWPTNN